jgi:hypothetical protein
LIKKNYPNNIPYLQFRKKKKKRKKRESVERRKMSIVSPKGNKQNLMNDSLGSPKAIFFTSVVGSNPIQNNLKRVKSSVFLKRNHRSASLSDLGFMKFFSFCFCSYFFFYFLF